MNRLEEGGKVSLSVGGSHLRPATVWAGLMGVVAGVGGMEGVGAGVHGGAGTTLDRVLVRDTGSGVGLSVTGVGGGALTADLFVDGGAGVCEGAGLDFKKGTGVAAGVFLVFP